MTVREIIRMGHPTLRELAEPYPVESIGSPAFDQLVEDLTDTLAASGGIGLAAPQINERYRSPSFIFLVGLTATVTLRRFR